MGIFDRFKKKKEAPAKASVAKKVESGKLSGRAGSGSAGKVESQKPKKEKKETKKKKAVSSLSRLATKTLITPVVSEKTAQLQDRGVLVFRVAVNANRVAVRQAFKELYKVTPLKVNIINVRGKRVKFGRVQGQRQNVKKALIFLPKGTRIDIFEGV